MPLVEIVLLGTPEIRYQGKTIDFPRRKAVALIAYLAVTDQRHSRDTVAELLWPDSDAARSRASLRRVLSSIGETPLNGLIDADRDTMVLNRGGDVWIDVAEFSRLVAQTDDSSAVERALELFRDNFMAGFTLRDSAEFDHWQSVQTQHLQHKLFAAFEQLTEQYVRRNELDAAAVVLRRWLDFDAIHDVAQRRLIEIYAVTGRRSAALSQYEAYAAALELELGVEPDVEMQELYERIKSDQPIAQHSVSKPVLGSLPPLPPLIVGREDSIVEVKGRLNVGIPGPVLTPAQVIIQGWPGIGKTTLSSALAHDYELQRHYEGGVLWTSLGQHPNLLAILMNWGQSLGFYDLERAQTVEEASARLTAFLRERRVLLILDDVWTVDHAVPLRVGGQSSGLLITTRLNDVARALADRPGAIYKIPILTLAESLTLLRTLAPEAVTEYPQESAELANDLEGLPLALQVAGRLLHAEMSFGWGIGDLLNDLREGKRLLEAQAPADRIELANETTPTIAALLKYSIERLSDELQEKFALLGVFAPKPATFTLPAIAAVWEVEDVRPAVRLFVDRGLLEPANVGSFQMHALLVMLAKSMFEAFD